MYLSMKTLEEQLYLGHQFTGCPYLSDRMANLLFLRGGDVGSLYRMLLDEGYRRSGIHLYRPDCHGCLECQILRIPVPAFQMSKSQKRVWKKGQIFDYRIVRPAANSEKLELYEKYLRFQHDGAAIDEDSYRRFLVESFLGKNTREIQVLHAGRLVGIGVFDIVVDAMSSVYFFFDPEYKEYSPGTYSVLLEMKLALEMDLRYYYPGYYIQGCKTMEYKTRFQPAEKKRIGEDSYNRIFFEKRPILPVE